MALSPPPPDPKAWEQRWHPLRREWVIVSAHRNDRPWQGERPVAHRGELPSYDPDCYLCPGNLRVAEVRNPAYRGLYVFDNDVPCVSPAAPAAEPAPGIYRSRPAAGHARVVAFTPRHDLSLAELSPDQLARLLQVLQAEHRDLSARPGVQQVLAFENKGEVTGVSNPHPHCQIYATNFVFKVMQEEAQAQAEYETAQGRRLFQDIIDTEVADGRRMLVERPHALAFVPYFARYPYETLVAPSGPRRSLADLSEPEIGDLAVVLRETLVRLENLWRMPFPYVMVFHQAPGDRGAYPSFQFYVQILPPLRRPGLLKYLAGPEVGGGNFLNDTAPEAKAAELRAASPIHYKAEASAV